MSAGLWGALAYHINARNLRGNFKNFGLGAMIAGLDKSVLVERYMEFRVRSDLSAPALEKLRSRQVLTSY